MIKPDRSYYGRQASRVRRYTSCTINCIRSVTAAFVVLCCSIELASAQTAAYQSLLESVQSPEIGVVEFPSLKWRKSTAQTLLTYCESAMSRIPWKSPSDVSLETEDNADVLAMPFEFSRGQLMIIFGDCIQFTQEILRTPDLRQEIRAWIKLNRLLEDDRTVLNLIVTAKMLQPERDGSYRDNIFEIANWRIVRVYVFEAILKLLEKS